MKQKTKVKKVDRKVIDNKIVIKESITQEEIEQLKKLLDSDPSLIWKFMRKREK